MTFRADCQFHSRQNNNKSRFILKTKIQKQVISSKNNQQQQQQTVKMCVMQMKVLSCQKVNEVIRLFSQNFTLCKICVGRKIEMFILSVKSSLHSSCVHILSGVKLKMNKNLLKLTERHAKVQSLVDLLNGIWNAYATTTVAIEVKIQ